MQRVADLPQLGGAFELGRVGPDAADRREQDADQQRNNADHDQQFDEGEGGLAFHSWHIRYIALMAKPDAAHPQDTEPYNYKITEVSTGCTKYHVGDSVVFFEPTPTPPPDTVTKSFAAPCTKVVYTLQPG